MTGISISIWRNSIFDNDTISSSAKLVGLALANYYIPNRLTYPSLPTIETITRLSRNTVISSIKQLSDNNLIKVSKVRLSNKSFTSNVYTFIGATIEQVNEPVNEQAIERAIDGATIAPEIDNKRNREEDSITHYDDSLKVNPASVVKSKLKFTIPTLDEINKYISEKNLKVDGCQFFEYFTAGEWTDSNGKKVKSWKQKLITWDKYSTDNKKEEPARREKTEAPPVQSPFDEPYNDPYPVLLTRL